MSVYCFIWAKASVEECRFKVLMFGYEQDAGSEIEGGAGSVAMCDRGGYFVFCQGRNACVRFGCCRGRRTKFLERPRFQLHLAFDTQCELEKWGVGIGRYGRFGDVQECAVFFQAA